MEEYQSAQDQSLFQLKLDTVSISTLRSSAAWAKVMAIAGFIFGILVIFLGLLVRNLLTEQGRAAPYNEQGIRYNSGLAATLGMLIYAAIGIVILASSFFAFNFARKITVALKVNDEAALSSGFSASRNFFALWAIILVIFCLLALFSVAGLAVGTTLMR